MSGAAFTLFSLFFFGCGFLMGIYLVFYWIEEKAENGDTITIRRTRYRVSKEGVEARR